MVLGMLVPFLGTVLGSGLAFFLPGGGRRWNRCLCAAAAGAMLASGVWSLLIPALEGPFWPVAAGFALGMLGLTAPDRVMERRGRKMDPSLLLILAVVLHNIPEGLAVGAGYGGFLAGERVSGLDAMTLALGIAVQNLPDGAVIVLPLAAAGIRKSRAFGIGVLTGLVEPVAAVVMLLCAGSLGWLLPGFMGFAAGAMVNVVVGELVPRMNEGEASPEGIFWFCAGFLLLMWVDVTLG